MRLTEERHIGIEASYRRINAVRWDQLRQLHKSYPTLDGFDRYEAYPRDAMNYLSGRVCVTNASQFTNFSGRESNAMLLTVTAIALVVLADPPARKEPPTKKELAAITERGRDLAGYDAAAWHASDAVQAKQPKEGSVVRYIARKIDKKWVVAFGRLDDKGEKFLIAYEATQGDKPDVFDVKEIIPPKEDTGFFLSAAKAIDTSLKDFMEHFEGEQRPYNVAVLPAEKGQVWVYLVPAPTKPNVWPLGGDVRYLISADGTKVVSKRQLHKSVIEVEPPKDNNNQQVAGFTRTYWTTHRRTRTCSTS